MFGATKFELKKNNNTVIEWTFEFEKRCLGLANANEDSEYAIEVEDKESGILTTSTTLCEFSLNSDRESLNLAFGFWHRQRVGGDE